VSKVPENLVNVYYTLYNRLVTLTVYIFSQFSLQVLFFCSSFRHCTVGTARCVCMTIIWWHNYTTRFKILLWSNTGAEHSSHSKCKWAPEHDQGSG